MKSIRDEEIINSGVKMRLAKILILFSLLILSISSSIYAQKPSPKSRSLLIFEYNSPKANEIMKTYWVTDFTPKGTKLLDTLSKEDFFSNVSKNAEVVLTYKNKYYFEYDGKLYRSNGTMQGTVAYRNFNQNIRHLFVHQNRLCYVGGREYRIYCFNFLGNQANSSLIMKLPVSRRIDHVASNVFDGRILISSTTRHPYKGKYIHELWISNGVKNPILLASNPNIGYDPKIIVTKNMLYFVANDSKRKTSRVTTLKNTKTFPRKLNFSNISLPKYVFSDEIFTDGNSLFFFKKEELYKIQGTIVGKRPIALLPLGYESSHPITVLNNQLLYSVTKQQNAKNGRRFVKNTLYKMNLKTGDDTKLFEKLYPYVAPLR